MKRSQPVQPRRPGRRRHRRSTALLLMVVVAVVAASSVAITATAAYTMEHRRQRGPGRASSINIEVQSLDGTGNNRRHPDWGKAGTDYTRVADARYTDGRSQPATGPNTRMVSNRVFNDVHQNIFNDRQVSQWGNVWAQFLDHTIGLREAPPDDRPPADAVANIPFNAKDPLETFTNTLGVIPFNRSTPGTGVSNAREQVNTVSSYIDAWAVYGGTDARLEWLREGPVDGDLSNNGPHLLLTDDRLLPRRDGRGDAATAPPMVLDGRLIGQPAKAMVAGDQRANENIALTAVHTLFAREHNRIVDRLPRWLSSEQRFQIARRVVIAEEQYVTYNEFLPAMGVQLGPYRGYEPDVDANLTNEFATVGYRGHSMIHGEIELEGDAALYTPATLDKLREQGIEITVTGDELKLAVPLNVAYFNPDLVPLLQLGPLLKGIGGEAEYRNDEQIDNQLRSVLFQIPVSGNPQCLDGTGLPACFKSVVDLGALDVERGRDHGMPSYNELRRAYGLAPRTTFRALTGDATEEFPADPLLTAGKEIDDPQSLDFTDLFDINGKRVDPKSDDAENVVTKAVRRTNLAARLKAIYGTVDKVDAFVGMVSEPHVAGTEFGELQLAMWRKQFQALRDGDRFFYLNDPGLGAIRHSYGLDFRRSLSQIIIDNTDVSRDDIQANVFKIAPAAPTPSASVSASASPSRPGLPPPPPSATPPGSVRPSRSRRR